MSVARLTSALQMFAELYNKELNQAQKKFYIDFLSVLPFDIVQRIFLTAIETKKFFPSISELKEIFDSFTQPPGDKKDLAMEMVGMIVPAMKRFSGNFPVEAREEIGELCWLVVERCGGWKCLCDTQEANLETLRAQLRHMCESILASRNNLKSSASMLDFQKKGTMQLKEIMSTQFLIEERN